MVPLGSCQHVSLGNRPQVTCVDNMRLMHSHFREGIPEKNTISFGQCLFYPTPPSPARNMGHYFHFFATRKCRYVDFGGDQMLEKGEILWTGGLPPLI